MQGLRRAGVLQQFGHQRLPGRDVGQADVRGFQQAESLDDGVGQPEMRCPTTIGRLHSMASRAAVPEASRDDVAGDHRRLRQPSSTRTPGASPSTASIAARQPAFAAGTSTCRPDVASQPACGISEAGQHPLDFAEAAAGQHGQHGRIGGDAERDPGRRAVGLQRDGVGQWMPDEPRVHAVPRVDRRFHRNRQSIAVGAIADLRRARFPPGPDRGLTSLHGARTPRCFFSRFRPRLKSGASMPMKTSGRQSSTRWRKALRSASRRGRCASTSARPITDSSLASCQVSTPAARIASPPMPAKAASGSVRAAPRPARHRAGRRGFPPAQRAMRGLMRCLFAWARNGMVRGRFKSLPGTFAWLGRFPGGTTALPAFVHRSNGRSPPSDEVQHRAHAARGGDLAELRARFVELGLAHVQRAIGTLDAGDAGGIEAAALEASALMPRGRAYFSCATIGNGGTSPLTKAPMPMNAWSPMRQNWCTPAKPLRMTWLPTLTWPASVALLENTQSLPTMQSWARGNAARIQLRSPMRVVPPPSPVPRLMVTNADRVAVADHQFDPPRRGTSCPAARRRSRHGRGTRCRGRSGSTLDLQCGPIRVPSPTSTSAPTTA